MGTCRLCLGSADMSIFFEDRIVSLKKFLVFTNFKIKKDDGYPQQICLSCLQKVEDFDDFILQCNENDKKLRSIKPATASIYNQFIDELKSFTVDDTESSEDNNDIETSSSDDSFEEPLNSDEEYERGKELRRQKKLENLNRKPLKNENNLCTICGESFEYKQFKLFQKHMSKHMRNQFQCDICKRKFSEKRFFDAHKLHHQTGELLCKFCKKIFKSASVLRKHVKFSHDNRYVQCTKCPYIARNAETLRRQHSKVHLGAGSYICDHCGKEFSNRLNILTHFKTVHSGSHACRFCEATFPHKSYVKEHEKLHRGEISNKCSICYKAYSSYENMRSHFKHNHKEANFKASRKEFRKAQLSYKSANAQSASQVNN